jgi:hypothetical protein
MPGVAPAKALLSGFVRQVVLRTSGRFALCTHKCMKTSAGRFAPAPPNAFSCAPKKRHQKKGVFARSQVCCLKRARPALHYPPPALRVYSSSQSNSSPSKQGALLYGPDIARSQKKKKAVGWATPTLLNHPWQSCRELHTLLAKKEKKPGRVCCAHHNPGAERPAKIFWTFGLPGAKRPAVCPPEK